MIHFLTDCFASVQGCLFQALVQPAVLYLGFGEFLEDAFEGTEWFMIGLCELAVLFAFLRPLEALFPAQPMSDARARLNDFIYTVVQRIGLFPVLIFFTLDPLTDWFASLLRLDNIHPVNLESLWTGITPLASFMLYLVVLDFFDYWYHRASHQFNWWWGLHSLHHSQENMNLWSDNRNHLFDDVLHDMYMALIALAIGVQPAQYVFLVSLARVLQSLQHANIRLHFGRIGEHLLVSPRFHRMHHAIGIGHESNGKGTLGGCNFAVLLPIWDVLFGTANFELAFVATGVRDQLPRTDADGVVVTGRRYGCGFWQQQWFGVKRMVEYLSHTPG